ncbi:DUF3299 domain-containing protein [Stutzerimonas stutzeri]|uniref:DUF3299 domain-containing protein n=1 Tax=Stutzerimonas sp. S1 TaxID=3030652 RepID=UPI002224935E|nr:DUF3299 domain-containing protein [Stutzerimonas sp. S1]MCW3149271.1 DUF3299 domain-containing protein [Stutzerimonas sp. S1]
MPRLFLSLLLCCASLVHAAPAELDWLELMPAEDRQALEEMPEIDHGGAEDPGFSDQGGLKQGAGLPAVMYSAKTVPALDGRPVRLGGYPVPLESDEQGRSTLFFLVPYPGACIHVPPPPPNQIVLVRYPQGIQLDDIYTPLWVDGPLRIEAVSNDLADAAYAIQAEAVEPVDEDDL